MQEEINEIIKKYEEEGLSYEKSRKRISIALQTYYPELLANFENETGSLDEIIENKKTDALVSEETSALMIENYRKFHNEMTGVFDGLNDLLRRFSSNTQEMVDSASRSISNLRGELQSAINETNTLSSSSSNGSGEKRFLNIGSGTFGRLQKIGKSHSGMELGYLGESSTSKNKENFRALTLDELKENELLRIVQKGEAILTEGQINQTMSNFKNLAEVKIPTITPLQKQTTNQSLNFNGDIIVQSNGDVNKLAQQIKTQLPAKFLQELNSRN